MQTAGANAAVKKLKDKLRATLGDVRKKKTSYIANEAGKQPQLMVHIGKILAKLVCPDCSSQLPEQGFLINWIVVVYLLLAARWRRYCGLHD